MKIKTTIKRIVAGLLAGALLTAQALPCSADGDTPLPFADTVLPSGKTVAQFGESMEKLASANNPAKEKYGFASAEVGIFGGGETLYTGYFGKVNYEDNIPADAESVYEWGSISKTFVWVSVMQLWEQGRIDLGRDVREYLPEGFFTHLSFDDPITMQNLMDHNAGWQETTHPIFVKDETAVKPLKEALQDIEPAQVSRPGEVVAYSNYGAAVAGYVVECVSGMSFTDYVHANILDPLGMEHTAVAPDHNDNQWVRQQREKCRSYGTSAMTDSLIDYGSKLEYVTCYPAGAATGTLEDLMTFGKALVDDTAPLFKSPETQEKLFSGSLFYGNSDIPMWSNGFECFEYGVRVYGHSGGTHFGQSNMLFDRESKTGLVVLVNEKNGNSFLGLAPTECFGMLPADKYGTGTGNTLEPAEYDFVTSRSWHRGMFGYFSLISAPTLIGKAEMIGDGVYQLVSGTGEERYATIIGAVRSPDGRLHIQQPSIEAISDGAFVPKIALLTAYLLTAVAASYMLRIRRKLKKSNRPEAFAGASAMTAAHRGRLVSALIMLAGFVLFYTAGGISLALSAVIGIAQAVCLGLCAVGTVCALAAVRSKKPKAKNWRYFSHAAANVLCAAGIIVFELYRFTGI